MREPELIVDFLRDHHLTTDADLDGTAVRGAAAVYNLAADMGGMGFIENNKALRLHKCARDYTS